MSARKIVESRRAPRLGLVVGVVVASMALTAQAAFAENNTSVTAGKAAVTSSSRTSAGDQYGEESIPTTVEKGKSAVAGVTATSPTSAPKSDTLPFTGLGLGAAAAIGGSLLLLGVFLRRRESRG